MSEERDAIVVWLRKQAMERARLAAEHERHGFRDCEMMAWANYHAFFELSGAIERGEHLAHPVEKEDGDGRMLPR